MNIFIDSFIHPHIRTFAFLQIERCNYLLKSFLEVAKREGEPADGRLLQHLLHNPAEDGGQWQMLVNVIEKYGLLPKKCFPESWNSEETRRLKEMINTKVCGYCTILTRTTLKYFCINHRDNHFFQFEIIKKDLASYLRFFRITYGMGLWPL